MKKYNFLMLLIGMMALLAACSPASEKDIMRYVVAEYGEAELLRTEVVSDDEIIYYFKDAEYGFEYYVNSKVRAIMIDGSKFGESESKSSDFNDAYYEYVVKQIETGLLDLEQAYDVDIVTALDDTSSYFSDTDFAEIYYLTDNTDTVSQLSKEVNDLFVAYDSRKFWRNSRTNVYDKNNNYLGVYSLQYDMWMTAEMEEDYFYIGHAQDLNEDAVFVRKEEILFKDTGIDINDVSHILGKELPTENSIVTYYYFEVNGKEFFLADILVYESPSDKWHTNYHEIFPQ